MATLLPNSAGSKIRQKIMNAQSTAATNNAKSGLTAERYAGLRNENKTLNPKVIKINSAPATRTTAGVTPKTSTVAKLFRPFKGGGFGGGLGGIMGSKIR